MKQFTVKTYGMPCQIEFDVSTTKTQTVYIKCCDASRMDRVFTDRHMKFNGTKHFIIKLPLSPSNKAVVFVNCPKQIADVSLQHVRKTPLPTHFNLFNYKDRKIARFVAFAEEFCLNRNKLSLGTYYEDTPRVNNRYIIKYVDVIRDNKTGNELTTPAKINLDTKIITVSRRMMNGFTIPMSMAILLHEFSHVYLNSDPKNEIEADMNAMDIYLGINYPTVEWGKAWARTYKNSSKGNPNAVSMKNGNVKRIKAMQDKLDSYSEFLKKEKISCQGA
jgi:hypothetical protein